MRRKRTWYWIEAPHGLWWVNGLREPVVLDHPVAKAKGCGNRRVARTMRKALSSAPPGVEIVRWITVRGKHYELRRWLTSAK